MKFTVTPVNETVPALNRPPPSPSLAAPPVPPWPSGAVAAAVGETSAAGVRVGPAGTAGPAGGIAAGAALDAAAAVGLVRVERAGGRWPGGGLGAVGHGSADVVEQPAALADAGDPSEAAGPADAMSAVAAVRRRRSCCPRCSRSGLPLPPMPPMPRPPAPPAPSAPPTATFDEIARLVVLVRVAPPPLKIPPPSPAPPLPPRPPFPPVPSPPFPPDWPRAPLPPWPPMPVPPAPPLPAGAAGDAVARERAGGPRQGDAAEVEQSSALAAPPFRRRPRSAVPGHRRSRRRASPLSPPCPPASGYAPSAPAPPWAWSARDRRAVDRQGRAGRVEDPAAFAGAAGAAGLAAEPDARATIGGRASGRARHAQWYHAEVTAAADRLVRRDRGLHQAKRPGLVGDPAAVGVAAGAPRYGARPADRLVVRHHDRVERQPAAAVEDPAPVAHD